MKADEWLEEDDEEPGSEHELSFEYATEVCGRHPGPAFRCDQGGTEYCQFVCPFSGKEGNAGNLFFELE